MTTTQLPVMDPAKLRARNELLGRYIQHRGLLVPEVQFEVRDHEYTSRINEPVMVTVHVRVYGLSRRTHQDQTFEFSLEELQMFQRQPFQPSGAAPTSRPAPATMPTVVADQIGWVQSRERIFARSSELEKDARRYVSRQTSGGAFRMECRCPRGSNEYMCDHLQFVYTVGWEREKLYDESGVGVVRRILLPIGMGRVYVELQADIIEDDDRPRGQWRTGYLRISDAPNQPESLMGKLATLTSPFPADVNHVMLGPGEGSIKAIRYIENMLRNTEGYEKMLKDDASRDAYSFANSICRRTHSGASGRTLVTKLMGGLHHGNSHRENWMLACAYSLAMDGMCLPCYEASTGSAGVPNF